MPLTVPNMHCRRKQQAAKAKSAQNKILGKNGARSKLSFSLSK